MENSNIDHSNRQSTSQNNNFHINTNPPIHISPIARSSTNSVDFFVKAENDNSRFRRPNLPYHEYSPTDDYVYPPNLTERQQTPNPHATVHAEHNSIFVSARPPSIFFSAPVGEESVFYENALTPASSSARHDSSGYIDRNGFKSTAGSVHSYATSDIASDMDVASEADFNSSGVAGNSRTLANRIVFVRSLIEAINSPEVTKIQWCPKGNCVMFHDRMKEETFRQEWRAIIGDSRSRSDEPATIIRNLNTELKYKSVIL